MNTGRTDPKQQFSKWLARSGAIYWIVFLTALLFLMYLRPEVSVPCVYMAVIVSIVMIFHVWAYTKNSTYEKGLLAVLDKTKMELDLSSKLSAITDGKTTTLTNNESTNG